MDGISQKVHETIWLMYSFVVRLDIIKMSTLSLKVWSNITEFIKSVGAIKHSYNILSSEQIRQLFIIFFFLVHENFL